MYNWIVDQMVNFAIWMKTGINLFESDVVEVTGLDNFMNYMILKAHYTEYFNDVAIWILIAGVIAIASITYVVIHAAKNSKN